MAKNTAIAIYQNSKNLIKEICKTELKTINKKDKAYRRQILNDLNDDLHRQIDWHAMKEAISKAQAEQYKNWLTAYAIKRHDK